eukprot:13645963-Heterocapsa_arctica.AAC.1
MYGAIVRSDLAYVAKELARRRATPSIGDMKRAKRLLRYVKRVKIATLPGGQVAVAQLFSP